jgi:hypothetical protein
MTDDPIVEEIRGHREEHAARFGHDLRRIVADLREKERRSARPLLNPGPRRIDRLADGAGLAFDDKVREAERP